MAITSLDVTGDYTLTSDCVPASPLAPQAACVVNVAFRPIGAGERVGVIRIDTDFHIVPVTINLKGIGAARAF